MIDLFFLVILDGHNADDFFACEHRDGQQTSRGAPPRWQILWKTSGLGVMG